MCKLQYAAMNAVSKLLKHWFAGRVRRDEGITCVREERLAWPLNMIMQQQRRRLQ